MYTVGDVPVGEAQSPGMSSSPDTKTFSGSRCITEVNAGCFFTAQSKCAPSTVLRKMPSAKETCMRHINTTYYTLFMENANVFWCDFQSLHHFQWYVIYLIDASWSNISLEALSCLTTWHITCKRYHLSIFHSAVCDPSATFHYSAKVIFMCSSEMTYTQMG